MVGAVGLQSGVSESIEKVQQKMKKRIAVIVGEDLDKKLTEQQEVEKTMSMQIAAEKKVTLERRPVEVSHLRFYFKTCCRFFVLLINSNTPATTRSLLVVALSAA